MIKAAIILVVVTAFKDYPTLIPLAAIFVMGSL